MRGEKPSNGNHNIQGLEPGLTNRIVRKLEGALREMDPLLQRGKVAGFFNDVKNADRLVSLTEDIRDAMIDYQVCPSQSAHSRLA